MREGKSILIVDGEPNLFITLQEVLSRAGYEVQVRENAQEAFRFLRNTVPDLVLLDPVLPDVDGMCLLAMCRRIHPNLPFLVITSDETVESTMQAIRLGARGYLIKPVDPEQILFCIAEIFHQQMASRRAPGKIRPTHIRRTVLDDMELTD